MKQTPSVNKDNKHAATKESPRMANMQLLSSTPGESLRSVILDSSVKAKPQSKDPGWFQ